MARKQPQTVEEYDQALADFDRSAARFGWVLWPCLFIVLLLEATA